MLRKIYAIRDAAVRSFDIPRAFLTHEEAIRSFKATCNNPEVIFNAHPEDYDLYCLADYDTNKGVLIPFDPPQHIAKAVDMIDRNQVPKNVLNKLAEVTSAAQQ